MEIRRGDEIAVVGSTRFDVTGVHHTVVIRRVLHVTLKGVVLCDHGGWFTPEEEGLTWARMEHADGLRVACAL